MNGASHQFLAHPCLPQNEDGKIRGRYDIDLAPQMFHGPAAANAFFPPAQILHQISGNHPLPLGVGLEGLHKICRPHLSCRQSRYRPQKSLVEGFKRHGVEGIGSEHPDELSLNIERAAEAGVNAAGGGGIAFDQTIERVR